MNIINNCKEETEYRKENWIGRIKGRQFLKFATEIAMGMEHLEAKGITHRDLAARNILLSADFTAKVFNLNFIIFLISLICIQF